MIIEINELKKNKNILIESISDFDTTINKFDDFWKKVLDDHDSVLSNLDPQIPIFKNLMKTLTQPERGRFKPILQIVAHSLQFLKKIISLDKSYQTEQLKLSSFTKMTNDSFQTVEKIEKDKNEFMNKQIENLNHEVYKYKQRELDLKSKIKQFESENEQLESQLHSLKENTTTKELAYLRSEKLKLEEDLDELKDRCDMLITENDNYKKQNTALISKIKENEKLIDKLQSHIEDEDTQSQIELLRSTNSKLREELIFKDNEIEVQRTEIINLQDALTELEDSTDTDQQQLAQKDPVIVSICYF